MAKKIAGGQQFTDKRGVESFMTDRQMLNREAGKRLMPRRQVKATGKK